MSHPQRVFITGYGSVNCLEGHAALAVHMSELAASASPAAPAGNRPIAAIDHGQYVDPRITRRMDRFTQMAYLAVRKALAGADVELARLHAERTGIIMNTCYGPLDSTRRYISKLICDGPKKVPAAVFPNTVHNAFTGLITMELAAHGSNSTVSGQNPICYGLDLLRQGRDDLLIVGGCDELLGTLESGFAAAGLDHQGDPAEPGAGLYDRDRNVFTLGEGAAVLVLENEASMRARGARPLAEVLDYGMANGMDKVAGKAFPGDAATLERVMAQALQRSGVTPAEVDLVSGAANGLARLTHAEMDALSAVFGKSRAPLVSNAKAALGETLGAASVFSTILALECLASGSVAPMPGVAPGSLPQRYVAGAARSAPLAVALVNGIELGGTITSLALRQPA
jgi:3-oxoacyl-[acyl-carrier-protein] synthase II